jgi:hypothetical protein
MLTVCAEEPVHGPAVSRRATTAIYYALAVEVALIVLFAVMYNPFDFNVYVWGGGSQSGRVLGSPNRGSTLLSKRVKAEIWLPATVSTSSPFAWATLARGSRT